MTTGDFPHCSQCHAEVDFDLAPLPATPCPAGTVDDPRHAWWIVDAPCGHQTRDDTDGMWDEWAVCRTCAQVFRAPAGCDPLKQHADYCKGEEISQR
jgi:hypothetical protein